MPDWLDLAAPFLPRLLREAGYTTAHFGKWHLGHALGAPPPSAYGLDYSATDSTSTGPRFGSDEIEQYRRGHPEAGSGVVDVELIPDFRDNSTCLIVDETLSFLRAHPQGPFYINVWTLLPHAPLHPTPEQLAPWKSLDPRPDAFQTWMCDYTAHAADLRGQSQVFAAAMSALDAQIGRLLDGLHELGLDRNTLILFSSDNGPEDYRVVNATNAGMGSTGPFRARKRSLYEGGLRTPLLVRWPGHVEAGTADTRSVLSAVDFLPTICALAGARLPEGYRFDGEDVSDIWLGSDRARRSALYWEWRFEVVGDEYTPPRYAVRDGNWKLFTNADRSHVELFDVIHDPEERWNVAAAHPDIAERLTTAATEWGKTLPDSPTAKASGAGQLH